ncbi:MAG: PH domain-containing protein [Gelidibacter sp.]
MNMNVYQSKSSAFVKIATLSVVALLILVMIGLIAIDTDFGIFGRVILPMLFVGIMTYFYSNSLDEIILEEDGIVLKKNIGQIKIPKSDILEVHELAYSNLTLTYGSKGVFGFIGNTMDDSVSLVKDRKQMLRITTKEKKYILSSENSVELVKKMKTFYNI